MVHGGGVDGMVGSGSGDLLTVSADISRRILSNLLNTWRKRANEKLSKLNKLKALWSTLTSLFTSNAFSGLHLISFHTFTLHSCFLSHCFSSNVFQLQVFASFWETHYVDNITARRTPNSLIPQTVRCHNEALLCV